MENDKYLLQSVYNALEVLDLLSSQGELGAAEISKELNMGKSSVFRILYTLEKKRYVQKASNAKYKLGIKFAHYGSIVIEQQDDFSFAKPFLRQLRDIVNETVHLAVLDNECNIVFIGKETGTSSITMSSRIGSTFPAYCTANGKCLLSYNYSEEIERKIYSFRFVRKTKQTIMDPETLISELKQILQQGYAVDFEESEIGLVCYSAPIFDIAGKAVAAISISGPTDRMQQNRKAMTQALKQISEEISKSMGYIKK